MCKQDSRSNVSVRLSENENNLPEQFHSLPIAEQKLLLNWIRSTFEPAKTVYRPRIGHQTSYGLKHDYAAAMRQTYPDQGDFYITNGQFKGAMLAAGISPVDDTQINWQFRMRRKRHTEGMNAAPIS